MGRGLSGTGFIRGIPMAEWFWWGLYITGGVLLLDALVRLFIILRFVWGRRVGDSDGE